MEITLLLSATWSTNTAIAKANATISYLLLWLSAEKYGQSTHLEKFKFYENMYIIDLWSRARGSLIFSLLGKVKVK